MCISLIFSPIGIYIMWLFSWLNSQFSFKKWLRPTAAKFVHLQDRGCDKIFSTPITIYGFSPVWVNMCLTWEVGFGNIYSQNSQFSLWKWLRPSMAKFMNLQHSGCDKIFSALITKPMFLRHFLMCWFNILHIWEVGFDKYFPHISQFPR